MTTGLEREQVPARGEVTEIPEEIEVPASLKRKDIHPTKTEFPDRIEIKGGQPVISPKEDNAPVVNVPVESEEQLKVLSKGSPDLSKTWYAKFWGRMWNIARHLGRGIVRMPNKDSK